MFPCLPDIVASLRAFLDTEDRWVIEACLANNRSRPCEPHEYASLEEQNATLYGLQAWVAD